MKKIFVQDLGKYETKLHAGHYIIDGKHVELEKPSLVLFEKTIQKVTVNNVAVRYVNDQGDSIPVSEYRKEISILRGLEELDELSKEQAHRLVDLSYYTPVYVEIQEVSDPYVFAEEISAKFETNNPYIEPRHYNGDYDGLYVFYKMLAANNIIKNTFKELGMVYQDGLSYEQTKNKKVWSNSNSDFEYIKAFGSYPFTELYKKMHQTQVVGSLEYCTDSYNKLYETITSLIKQRYNIHFGEYTGSEEDLKQHALYLEQLHKSVDELDVIKKHYDKKRLILKGIKDAKYMFASKFKENEN